MMRSWFSTAVRGSDGERQDLRARELPSVQQEVPTQALRKKDLRAAWEDKETKRGIPTGNQPSPSREKREATCIKSLLCAEYFAIDFMGS